MDMQKVEMLLRWNDTFTENAVLKTEGSSVDFTFNEALSNEKGK